MNSPKNPNSTERVNPELWDFPCNIAFKAMAVNRDDIEVDIIAAVHKVIPDDYSPQLKPSAKGNYVSVTLSITFHNAEQVENVYRNVRAVADVKMCL